MNRYILAAALIVLALIGMVIFSYKEARHQLLLLACQQAQADAKPIRPPVSSILAIENKTKDPTTVYVAFGADSVVLPANWPFCTGGGLNCSFPMAKLSARPLPLGGAYLNATFSFGAPVTCNTTKAEININNPGWYDTLDVSLVDGFSNKISILATPFGSKSPILLGPPKGKDGNEKVYGLFPNGCDVCVARQRPPCGMTPGRNGCKSGSQYNPSVPCQYQGPSKTLGNQNVVIRLQD